MYTRYIGNIYIHIENKGSGDPLSLEILNSSSGDSMIMSVLSIITGIGSALSS
jgi:hypothetical protein